MLVISESCRTSRAMRASCGSVERAMLVNRSHGVPV